MTKNKELENCYNKLCDIQEELDYYRSKCASLETGIFNLERENHQLNLKNEESSEIIKELEIEVGILRNRLELYELIYDVFLEGI